MEQLISILRRALNTKLEEGWLYLPRGMDWRPETLAVILNTDMINGKELDSEAAPLIVKRHRLAATLDTQTIEDIARNVRLIEEMPSDEVLLEAFVYYWKHDAFLPERGYEPPSAEETMARLDQEFYDSLGDESRSEKCKQEGCTRGRIGSGVFCRVHHFEMVKRKPCPYMH